MIVGIFARGAALLFALFAGSANAAEAEFATAPKAAKSWTIVSAGGSHGEEQVADGDVSKSLNALRRVETVMQGGKMMDAQALREAVGITGVPAL